MANIEELKDKVKEQIELLVNFSKSLDNKEYYNNFPYLDLRLQHLEKSIAEFLLSDLKVKDIYGNSLNYCDAVMMKIRSAENTKFIIGTIKNITWDENNIYLVVDTTNEDVFLIKPNECVLINSKEIKELFKIQTIINQDFLVPVDVLVPKMKGE